MLIQTQLLFFDWRVRSGVCEFVGNDRRRTFWTWHTRCFGWVQYLGLKTHLCDQIQALCSHLGMASVLKDLIAESISHDSIELNKTYLRLLIEAVKERFIHLMLQFERHVLIDKALEGGLLVK